MFPVFPYSFPFEQLVEMMEREEKMYSPIENEKYYCKIPKYRDLFPQFPVSFSKRWSVVGGYHEYNLFRTHVYM